MPEMNVREFVRMLIESYRFLIVITVVVVIVAVISAFVTRPTYRSEVVLIPASYNSNESTFGGALGNIGGLASLAGISVGARDQTEEAMATLYSRTFIESFVRENNLLPVLFSEDWDAESDSWSVSRDSVPTEYDGYQRMIDRVMSTKSSSTSSVIHFRIDWSDPEIAATWANELITRLNERLRMRAIDEANKSIEFLNTELKKSNILEIQQGIYTLIEGRIQEIMLANVRTEYAFRIIDVAAPPDRDDWIRPNRILIIVLSVPFGLLAGMFLLLFRRAMHED